MGIAGGYEVRMGLRYGEADEDVRVFFEGLGMEEPVSKRIDGCKATLLQDRYPPIIRCKYRTQPGIVLPCSPTRQNQRSIGAWIRAIYYIPSVPSNTTYFTPTHPVHPLPSPKLPWPPNLPQPIQSIRLLKRLVGRGSEGLAGGIGYE
jgi:hypothetical protein